MQGRKNLMKNKTKFAFLTLAVTAAMLLGACQKPASSSKVGESINPTSETSSGENSQPSSDIPSSQISEQGTSEAVNPSSTPVVPSSQVTPSSSAQPGSSTQPSSQPSESSVVSNKCTVTFVAEGQVVYTVEVDKGETATYEGETPTKPADANGSYKFVGWDKDLSAPINADTTFTAVFALFAKEIMIDDFESYEESGDMIDEGWVSLGYSNSTGTWTDQTGATVSLGTKSIEGEKALKFEAWENTVGYKFAKTFKPSEFTDSANAIQFTLMAPSINSFTLLLNCNTIVIGGQEKAPVFKYRPTIKSSEYVTYTIPFNDSGWFLWDSPSSITDACAWAGVADTDFLSWLTGIEFYLQGDDGGNGLPYKAFLDSVKFVTLDNPAYSEVQYNTLYDRYTGTLNNDHILRVDIDHNNNAIASVIDLETPVQVGGAIEVNDNIVTFTSSDNGATLQYVGRLTNGGALIKFESATGTLANDVEDMNLTGVQVVNNFEQYTEDGQAYYKDSPASARSGCRGDFYSEYYSGSASDHSPWGGDKWSLLGGDGSQLKLKQDSGAHSGNQYLCMKNAPSVGMRYMQWGLYDGSSEKCAFRGSKMGFWAKTNGVVKQFTAYMYSQNAPTNATRDQYVKKATFTETAAISEWKHYEVELNPNVVYYGFMFFIEANWSADSHLYVDDVEIYSANPYAHYEEPVPEPEKDYNLVPGTKYFGKYKELMKADLTINLVNSATFVIDQLDLEITGSISVDEYEITMVFDDTTVKYTTTDSKRALTFKSATGSLASYLNNLSLDIILGDNAETYEDDGTMYYQGNTNEDARSGARGAYFCDYYSGGGSDPLGGNGWQIMGGNGDQLQLDKTNAFEGSQSLKLKRNKSMDMRYLQWCLYKGDGEPITGMDKFVVYYKNPTAEAITVRTMVYKIRQIAPGTQGAENRAGIDFEVPANSGWVRCELALDPNTTYYGFGFMPMKATGATVTDYINVDYAHYEKAGESPEYRFYTKENLTLSTADASIKFGTFGNAVFNRASTGLSNVAITYTFEMSGVTQYIVFSIYGQTVKGNYQVNYNGEARIYITEVADSLRTYISTTDVFVGSLS